MAALGSQTIASSYEQLLHVDNDGGGNGATLVSVKDGDNGTTFALQLATDNIAVTGDIKISKASGSTTQSFVPASGQSSQIKFMQDDGTTQDARIFAPEGVTKLAFEAGTTEMMRITTTGVGIGTSSPASAAGGNALDIRDTNTSSATQGASLKLGSNDGAVMGAGHRMGVIEFAGPEDGGGTMVGGARIDALAVDAFTATGTYDHNSKLRFSVQSGVSGTDQLAVPAMILDANSEISLSNNDLGGTGGADGTTGNTIFGMYAGLAIASGGIDNSFFGHASGNKHTTGDYCTGIGGHAGYHNLTGSRNTHVGYFAGYGASGNSNSDNTSVGFSALKLVTTGADNVAVGAYAGINMTSGSSNVFIGKSAGNAYNSTQVTAVGANACGSITSANGDGTTAVGYYALKSQTSGQQNTAIGSYNSDDITTGSYNTAIGRSTLASLTTGSNNIAIGRATFSTAADDEAHNIAIGNSALGSAKQNGLVASVSREVKHNIAIGQDALLGGTLAGSDDIANNIAIGSYALDATATNPQGGTIAIGHQSLTSLTSGLRNTAIGYQSAYYNSSGNDNTYLGYWAGSGTSGSHSNNVGIGSSALGVISDGGSNVAIGKSAAALLTTGTNNIAIGHEAFDSANGAEDNNIAIGLSALGNADHDDMERNIAIGNYSGDGMGAFANLDNIFIGHGAGGGTWVNNNSDSNVSIGNYSMDAAMDDANYNTGLGHQTLSALTTANGNVCVGFQSGTAITTGIHNICIGYQAGNNITESQGNVLIGTGAAAAHATASSGDNSIVISAGTNAVTSAGTETIRIGVDSDFITCDFGEDATWSHSSDERIKKEIKDNTLGLDFINDLRTVTFKKKAPSEYPKEFDQYNAEKTKRKNHGKINYGFIAQEVKKSMDKAGHSEFPVWKENVDTMQELGETELITPLVKAIQELTARVKELENK
jgi:hypothetical protein